MSNVIALDEMMHRQFHYTKFIRMHPEYTGLVGFVMIIVSRCPDTDLRPPEMDLHAIHDHIYGQHGCTNCRREFESRQKYERTHVCPPRIYG